MFRLFQPKSILMNRNRIPTRLSPQEIESKRNKLKAYAVLPVPEHAVPGQFETIGRTTFKKYIQKAYETLYSKSAFPIAEFWNIPYIISPDATFPHVVNITPQSQTQSQPPAQLQAATAQSPRQISAAVSAPVSAPIPASVLAPVTQINPSMSNFSADDGTYYAPSHRKFTLHKIIFDIWRSINWSDCY